MLIDARYVYLEHPTIIIVFGVYKYIYKPIIQICLIIICFLFQNQYHCKIALFLDVYKNKNVYVNSCQTCTVNVKYVVLMQIITIEIYINQ